MNEMNIETKENDSKIIEEKYEKEIIEINKEEKSHTIEDNNIKEKEVNLKEKKSGIKNEIIKKHKSKDIYLIPHEKIVFTEKMSVELLYKGSEEEINVNQLDNDNNKEIK